MVETNEDERTEPDGVHAFGEMRAFGRKSENIFKELNLVRRKQIELAAEHIRLESFPSEGLAMGGDTDEDTADAYRRNAERFARKEADMVKLMDKLEDLGRAMSNFRDVSNSMKQTVVESDPQKSRYSLSSMPSDTSLASTIPSTAELMPYKIENPADPLLSASHRRISSSAGNSTRSGTSASLQSAVSTTASDMPSLRQISNLMGSSRSVSLSRANDMADGHQGNLPINPDTSRYKPSSTALRSATSLPQLAPIMDRSNYYDSIELQDIRKDV